MQASTGSKPVTRTERFFGNVLWNWLGVAVNLFIAVFLSPYIVRKLGAEGFGIWTLLLGLLEYYWLLDLGFRSATLKYSAHYRTTGEPERINEILNTALVCASTMGLTLLAITFVFAHRFVGFFQVSPAYQPIFAKLIMIVGTGWALGVVLNMFHACLEGFQRFDITSRIWILTNLLRAVVSVILLYRGYGLIAMGLTVVLSQMLGYGIAFLAVRRVFPQVRFSSSLVKMSTGAQMMRYGVHTFLATVGDRTLNQSGPLLIGHYRPSAFVGYFGLPVRLMQYAVDIVMRVGMVSSSSASEFSAKDDMESTTRLGIYSNRYCLTLFTPIAILFLAYGREVIQVWIGRDFADHSAPIIPILVLSSWFAIAGQFNSSSILYGLGKHAGYARGLLVEAFLNVCCLMVVIPRYGIVGAAWVVAVLMILNRGLWTPVLLCRHVGCRLPVYLRSIYGPPLLAALPVLALTWILKMFWIPGRNLFELLLAAILVGTAYFGLAFFVCLSRWHRAAMLRWAAERSHISALGHLAAAFEK